MKILLVFCFVILTSQIITAQVLRPQYNFLNRPGAETVVETNKYQPSQCPQVINETPTTNYIPIPSPVSDPTTTIITDCSPTICKNLVNTIQLMIVSNLLQNNNKGNSEIALQLASPIINEVLTSPTFATNPISSFISPNLVSPSIVSPNVISPNYVSQNVPYTSNILSHSAVPLVPTLVTNPNIYPNNIIPNAVSPSIAITGQTPNTNDLINTLMNLLGNVKM